MRVAAAGLVVGVALLQGNLARASDGTASTDAATSAQSVVSAQSTTPATMTAATLGADQLPPPVATPDLLGVREVSSDFSKLPAADSHNPGRPAALWGLYGSFAGLQIYDAVSTTKGLQLGAREANGVISGLVGNPAALWALKGGVSAGSILLAERLWRQHRRTEAVATMVIANGVMGVVAARNASIVHSLR